MKTVLTFLTFISLTTTPALAQPKKPSQIEKARALYNKGNFTAAASEFFKIESGPEFLQGRFGFGLSLMRLNLPHLASIPLMTVATQATGKPQKKALDLLVKISYDTNNTSLLNYSINKLTTADLEETSHEVYYNRLAEFYHESGNFEEALKNLKLVLQKNPDNEKALHLTGLILLKTNQPEKAAEQFRYLASFWERKAPNDETRGVALANQARALYQAKKFSEAESIYRQIPKDHSLYRKVQMEIAWTLFRSGKIRSALSSLQTLHTPYYENFYDPESFILRSIILTFACQADEAMKSILGFENNFKGLDGALTTWIERKPDIATTINEIQIAQQKISNPNLDKKGVLPFFVVRTLIDTHPLNSLLKSKRDILKEQQLFQKHFTKKISRPMLTYTKKAYTARLRNLDKNIARIFNFNISSFQKDFRDLESQVEFLKYEILEEQKRATKARMTDSKKLDDSEKRSFYVQNGFRYWPFNGEYWIDEIGNYQYLGVNRCEN